jgi:hypothetical protein
MPNIKMLVTQYLKRPKSGVQKIEKIVGYLEKFPSGPFCWRSQMHFRGLWNFGQFLSEFLQEASITERKDL